MKLKDFLKYFVGDIRLELYINNEISLSCEIDIALNLMVNDKRGELLVTEKSVDFKDEYYGFSAVRHKVIRVYCNT